MGDSQTLYRLNVCWDPALPQQPDLLVLWEDTPASSPCTPIQPGTTLKIPPALP